MREERKLEKAIQRDGEQTQSDILDELKRRYPQYTKQSDNKQPTVKKRRIAVFSSLAAVAACLAIILPCALLLSNRRPSSGGGSGIYYCSSNEYNVIEGDNTLREYSMSNNSKVLFFNWYEIAEELLTEQFIKVNNQEILGVRESAYNPETDEFITISVTKSNVFLSEFDVQKETCTEEYILGDNKIKWAIGSQTANCIFEHNGYRYFLQIEAGQDESRLFALVEELLQNK